MIRRARGSAPLALGGIEVRSLEPRDRKAWLAVRLENEDWLQPWEASVHTHNVVSWAERHTPATYRDLLARQHDGLREGTQLPYGIFLDGRFMGQVNIGEIVGGALCSGSVGYWIDRRWAGRGLTPVAVALVADRAFRNEGLHRIEANIRPDNTSSLAVARKVGFANEGLRRKYLAINGQWCDHLSWSLLVDDYPGGVFAAMAERHPEVVSGFPESRSALVRKV